MSLALSEPGEAMLIRDSHGRALPPGLQLDCAIGAVLSAQRRLDNQDRPDDDRCGSARGFLSSGRH